MAAEGDCDVDRYEWLQLIFSEHGPKTPAERCVLGVIYCHTSAKRAIAWPSQATIAKRSQLSERQVKRVLAKLAEDGWLRRELTRHGAGKGWRMTVYYPSLPVALYEADLVSDRPDHRQPPRRSAPKAAQDREQPRRDNVVSPMSPPSPAPERVERTARELAASRERMDARSEARELGQETSRLAASEREFVAARAEGDALRAGADIVGTSKPMVGTSKAHRGDITGLGGDISGQMVVTQLCPTNPPSESTIQKSKKEGAHGIAALASAQGGFENSSGRRKLEKEPEPERYEKALVLLRSDPNYPTDQLARMYQLTDARVEQARRSLEAITARRAAS